jgi:tetraacyldisaccharide 4'-kinase
MAKAGQKAPCPVICVGNFVAGGAGKTPLALKLAEILIEAGHRPVFLSRGHGGVLKGPVLVDSIQHGPRDVGDEPLLLARVAPVVIARDRAAGALMAAKQGDVIVMDDGMQNPSLFKDLTFAVVDAGQGLGNAFCLPAGPLRAPFPVQAEKVDFCVNVGGIAPEMVQKAFAGRLLKARLLPDPAMAARLKGERVFAVSGIGRPQKFEASLRELGAILVENRAFPDHHPYSRHEFEQILADAKRLRAIPVTTEKDFVRMVACAPDRADAIEVLPVKLVISDEEQLRKRLKNLFS